MNVYRLPCSCGHEIPIETKQAGQTVRCQCGAELDVPTMQGIAKLQSMESPSTPTRRTGRRWGVRQQLILIGGTIAFLALLALVFQVWKMPRFRAVDDLTPGQTLGLWSELRRGVEYRSRSEKALQQMRRNDQRWLGVTGVVAGLGILTMLSAWFVPPDSGREARD